MKRVFETAECEAVRNSIFWKLRYEKHENQMKACGVKKNTSENKNTQMSKLFIADAHLWLHTKRVYPLVSK